MLECKKASVIQWFLLGQVCGPPGMMNHISGDKAKDRSQGELTGILKELGYTAEMVYKF
jgi:cytochrome-b5 reductase